jgi:hypothetical protein
VKLIDLETFMKNYYIYNGFSYNRCTGQEVKPTDQLIGVVPLGGKEVMISAKGPSNILLEYPKDNKVQIASGSYSFTYAVEGNAVFEPYEYEGEIISLDKDGGTYEGAYMFGNYNGLNAYYTAEELAAARSVTFYVPVEQTSPNLDPFSISKKIVQPDGTFAADLYVGWDDECDVVVAASPDKDYSHLDDTHEKIPVTVSKETIEYLLWPKVE